MYTDSVKAIVNLQGQVDKIKSEHHTEHNDPQLEEYWRGVRIGLETSINVLIDHLCERMTPIQVSLLKLDFIQQLK